MNKKFEQPNILPIAEVKKEGQDLFSWRIKYLLRAKPGQFVMVWLPGVDEKPISVSGQTEGDFTLTMNVVGSCTKKMAALKAGDKIGIRGPYGHGFSIEPRNRVIVVGGGCGTAPLFFLTNELIKKDCSVEFINGAVTKDRLLFREELGNMRVGSCLMTDDGSQGKKGMPTKELEKILRQKKVDKVYCCGPEKMMAAVVEICRKMNVPLEVSLERYMKCGFGVCGQCSVDPLGIRVCQEGPVVSGETAAKITELGKYYRDKSGRKVHI